MVMMRQAPVRTAESLERVCRCITHHFVNPGYLDKPDFQIFADLIILFSEFPPAAPTTTTHHRPLATGHRRGACVLVLWRRVVAVSGEAGPAG